MKGKHQGVVVDEYQAGVGKNVHGSGNTVIFGSVHSDQATVKSGGKLLLREGNAAVFEDAAAVFLLDHIAQKLISDRLVDVGKFGKIQFDCYISMAVEILYIEGRGILEKGKAVGKLADILHRLVQNDPRKILSFIKGAIVPDYLV